MHGEWNGRVVGDSGVQIIGVIGEIPADPADPPNSRTGAVNLMKRLHCRVLVAYEHMRYLHCTTIFRTNVLQLSSLLRIPLH
jgi:hypothetical protein